MERGKESPQTFYRIYAFDSWMSDGYGVICGVRRRRSLNCYDCLLALFERRLMQSWATR